MAIKPMRNTSHELGNNPANLFSPTDTLLTADAAIISWCFFLTFAIQNYGIIGLNLKLNLNNTFFGWLQK
jgi:hypothetical protein